MDSDGTLAGRELSAYLVSTQLGWNLVPHTIIRRRNWLACQLWRSNPADAVDSDLPPGPDLVDLFRPSAAAGHLPVRGPTTTLVARSF